MEGGEEELHCVCADKSVVYCLYVDSQAAYEPVHIHMYHDENVNLALEELDS